LALIEIAEIFDYNTAVREAGDDFEIASHGFDKAAQCFRP